MTWTRERWQRIEALFHEVVPCDAAERGPLLAAQCGGDDDLRRAVESLLSADGDDGSWIDGGLAGALHGQDPLLQQRFGAFRLVERIADGGMGTVYRAERCDGEFAQEVAVKVLRAGFHTTSMRERFARERRTLAALVHPNVARIVDGGTTEHGVPFLAMEFVDGVRFDRFCDDAGADLRTRLRLFVTVCRAAHFAHQNLVVHLDLKPSNILVDGHGVPKLVDFGVAGLLENSVDGAAVAATRSRPLTPEYASPELLRGERVSIAADVYSLGVVLFELLTGVRAFRSTCSDLDLMKAVCETEAPRPSATFVAGAEPGNDAAPSLERAHKRAASPAELHRSLRGDLDRIVQKAMRKEPVQRYGTCQELAEDIERWLAGFPVTARPASLGYRLRKFVGRHALAVTAGIAVLIALVAGLWATLHLAAVARVERDEASRARAEAERERDVAAAARREAEVERDAASAARDRVAHEMQHARVEAMSNQVVARFLGETLVSSQFVVADDAERSRMLATIEQRAEQVRRQYADAAHLRANLLHALGRACVAVDAFASGEALLREAQAIRKEGFGEHSLENALSLGSLGQLWYQQGRLPDAAAALRQAYALHKECAVDVHTDVAQAANDLAAVERALGNRDRARELHLEALALRRHDGDGLLIAESLNNLANTETDLQQAQDLLTESHRLRAETLGEDDPLTIQSTVNLGSLAVSRARFAEARDLLQDAVRRCRGLGATGTDALAMALRSLAYAQRQLGDLAAAAAAITEALVLDRRRFGTSHPRIAGLLEVKASIAEAREDWATAVSTWTEVLTLRRAALPAGHRLIGVTMLSLGGAMVRQGQVAEGLQQLDAAMSEFDEGRSATPADRVDGLRLRADALERRERFAEAELALLGAERLVAAGGVDATRAADVRTRLHRFYLRRLQPEQAANYAQK